MKVFSSRKMATAVFRRVRAGFCRFVFTMFSLVMEIIFRWIYQDYHRPLPPIKNPILLETAQSLALKIRTKKLRSEEVIESFISRIREVNPIINAVVDERFGAALEEARAVDRLVASGKKTSQQLAVETPLLGVPFTVKDICQVKGLRITCGHAGRKDVVATVDSEVVKLMKRAGAIPIAMTNIPELCFWGETKNNIYGRTTNPYNSSRTVGGSSGGEAAIISAAGSVIGIGTDMGGSIRVPSLFTGIFGHKPSRGIVSNDGEYPHVEGRVADYNTTGPMCRYASDLSLMYKVMAGQNVKHLKLEEKVDFKKVKLYYMEDDGGSILSSQLNGEIKNAMKKALKHFETSYGIKAQKVNMKEMRHASTIFMTKIATGSKFTFPQELGLRKKSINPYWELLKWCLGLSIHTLPPLLLSMRKAPKEGDKIDKRCDVWIQDLHGKLKECIKEDGIFIYPTQPIQAFYHNQCFLTAHNVGYTSIFNILGLPSTACPLGLSKENKLPLGIQVVSWHANDHLCFAAARELERAFGGWVPPSKIL